MIRTSAVGRQIACGPSHSGVVGKQEVIRLLPDGASYDQNPGPDLVAEPVSEIA